VFQFFYLLPYLSVRDNVALPELIAGRPKHAFDDRTEELLDRVGLLDRADDNIQKLSGGEMQRVAICRALLRRPRLLLADEPTGNLDDESARSVMDLMLHLASEERGTIVFVTHSQEMARLADITWRLHSGLLENP
jgi:ABC-type lipoprotein export system ATPase subunit